MWGGAVPFLLVLNPLSAWQVLGELVGDKNLEKFRIEYEKLHRYVDRGEQMSKRVVRGGCDGICKRTTAYAKK
jgi:hypothetical protein